MKFSICSFSHLTEYINLCIEKKPEHNKALFNMMFGDIPFYSKQMTTDWIEKYGDMFVNDNEISPNSLYYKKEYKSFLLLSYDKYSIYINLIQYHPETFLNYNFFLREIVLYENFDNFNKSDLVVAVKLSGLAINIDEPPENFFLIKS